MNNFSMCITFEEADGTWNSILINEENDMKYFDPILTDALKALEEEHGSLDGCKHEGVKYCSYCGHKL